MRNSFLGIIGLLGLIVISCQLVQQTVQPTPQLTAPPEAVDATIEYSTVAEALAALKARDDVLVEAKDGWTIATEADGLTVWSFTPTTHPAHPVVAKRVVYRQQDGWYMDMATKCEADKAACDQFVRDFEELDEQMRQFIEQDQLTKQAP